MDQLNTITSNTILEDLNKTDSRIIDIRPVDSYNGWSYFGENRNGHIEGALSLPFKWLGTSYWNELLNIHEVKNRQTLIIYGAFQDQIEETAMWFMSAGYPSVFVYFDFIGKWTSDEIFPMEKLPLYEKLVPPGYIWENLNNENLVICHCHYQNSKSYEKGHIKGSVELNTLMLESELTWNKRNPAELANTISLLGINLHTTVILYGEHDEGFCNQSLGEKNIGHLAAFRCALILLYAGIKDVRILNGGLNSWKEENYPLSKELNRVKKIGLTDFDIPLNPELLIDLEDVRDLSGLGDKNIISVRSWPEFIGRVSGYDYIMSKGRIPGSIFSDCGKDAFHMEKYRNPDQSCRDYKQISKMWKKIHIDKRKTNIFYCGTGWKASEAWFHAYLMDWKDIAVYDGGWYEWSSHKENPIELGISKNSF